VNKSRLNKLALPILVTLFLLNTFSNNIFAQQTAAAADTKDFQFSTNETAKTAPDKLTSEETVLPNRPKISQEKITFPKANIFPPAKNQIGTPYVRPSKDQRFKRYLNRMFGPFALLGSAASAGISQLTDEPEEWENNAKGYGRRLANNVGRNIISQTVTYGLDEAFKLDSSYYKSGSKKFKDRLKNAVLSTFTARKPDGKRVFGFPRVAGTLAGAMIANQFWYPSRFDYKDGIRSGAFSLGTSVGVNFLREFF
jgi:hypothetical protein